MKTLKKKIRTEKGQVILEYIIVSLMVSLVLFMPVDDRPLFELVIERMRSMHNGYMTGMSTYAYPF